jgi:hypothetical protein
MTSCFAVAHVHGDIVRLLAAMCAEDDESVAFRHPVLWSKDRYLDKDAVFVLYPTLRSFVMVDGFYVDPILSNPECIRPAYDELNPKLFATVLGGAPPVACPRDVRSTLGVASVFLFRVTGAVHRGQGVSQHTSRQ